MKKYVFGLLSYVFFLSVGIHPTEEPPQETILLVASLHKNSPLSLKYPSEYCLEDNILYTGATHRVGGLNIFLTRGKSGKIPDFPFVSILGVKQKGVLDKLSRKGQCPDHYGVMESSQQIRSDWVAEETGFTVGRSTSEKMKGLQYIEAIETNEFKGFSLVMLKEKSQYKAVFTNTLEFPIRNLQISAHYESHGFGKPMPHYLPKKFPLVKPGQKATYLFPSVKEESSNERRKRSYRFSSVLAQSSMPGIQIDLEIFKPDIRKK